MQPDRKRESRRAANRRTATVLLSVVAVLFCGIILTQYSGAPAVTVGVLGLAILGFLSISIGRDVGRRGRQ